MALGLFSLISTRAPALDAAAGASSIGEWEAAWTKVLTRHVDDSGRIDFDSLRRNHADLDLVVAFVAAVGPITLPRQFPALGFSRTRLEFDCLHQSLSRAAVRFLEYHWTVNHRKWAYVR